MRSNDQRPELIQVFAPMDFSHRHPDEGRDLRNSLGVPTLKDLVTGRCTRPSSVAIGDWRGSRAEHGLTVWEGRSNFEHVLWGQTHGSDP